MSSFKPDSSPGERIGARLGEGLNEKWDLFSFLYTNPIQSFMKNTKEGIPVEDEFNDGTLVVDEVKDSVEDALWLQLYGDL